MSQKGEAGERWREKGKGEEGGTRRKRKREGGGVKERKKKEDEEGKVHGKSWYMRKGAKEVLEGKVWNETRGMRRSLSM